MWYVSSHSRYPLSVSSYCPSVMNGPRPRVKNMRPRGLPRALVIILLMLNFMHGMERRSGDLLVLELFAGKGEIWRQASARGLPSRGMDLDYSATSASVQFNILAKRSLLRYRYEHCLAMARHRSSYVLVHIFILCPSTRI